MRASFIRLVAAALTLGIALNLSGCAALKKKFTRKPKKPPRKEVYFQVRKYDIKPSMELYEKHYVYWINWQRNLIQRMGENFKKDSRSIQESIGNLEDMSALLVDEKAAELEPHIEDLREAKIVIYKRNLTKANETRIRHILERVLRVVKREFSPKKMKGYIRKEWK